MAPVRTLEGKILEGWEKRLSKNGIPYYANHNVEHTQWDHPLLHAVMDELRDHNIIKYAAYRMAAKLRTLQKVLKMHQVSLAAVGSIFDQVPFQPGLLDATVKCTDLEDLIQDVFSVACHENATLTDVELAAELTWNFLLNVLDPQRTGTVRVFSVLVVLVVLCDGRLLEKYKYLFRRLADHNNCITKSKLWILLSEMGEVPEYFMEKQSFGKCLVSATVDSCFRDHTGPLGICEEFFFVWLLREPQTLVWFSTFFRLVTAELVSHNVKCCICKMNPMTGLRYQCLQCFKYDLCQHCFFTGQISRGHKLKHPMQEYYAESTSKQEMKAFVKRVGNFLRLSKTRPSYLPINCTLTVVSNSEDSVGLPKDTTTFLNAYADERAMVSKIMQTDDFPQECCSRTVVNGTPLGSMLVSQHRELESVIVHLEREQQNIAKEIARYRESPGNSGGSEELDSSCVSQPDVLEEFNEQLELQIARLKKILKAYVKLKNSPKHVTLQPGKQFESTPAAAIPRAVFSHISPIESSSRRCADMTTFGTPGKSLSRIPIDETEEEEETGYTVNGTSAYSRSGTRYSENQSQSRSRDVTASFYNSTNGTPQKRLHSTSVNNGTSLYANHGMSATRYLRDDISHIKHGTASDYYNNSTVSNSHFITAVSSKNASLADASSIMRSSIATAADESSCAPNGRLVALSSKYPSQNTTHYFHNSLLQPADVSHLVNIHAAEDTTTGGEQPTQMTSLSSSSAYSSMAASTTGRNSPNNVPQSPDSAFGSVPGDAAGQPALFYPSDDSSRLLTSLQAELDDILQQLEDSLPPDSDKPAQFSSGEQSHLLQAAVDVGNVLADLVENISLKDTSVNNKNQQ